MAVSRPSSPVRVHVRVRGIVIRGNTRTKDTVIESEVEELLRGAATFQELRHAAAAVEERLRGLGVFESVNVRVYAGPPELPGTANVIIEVSEPSNSFAGKLRGLAKFGARPYGRTGTWFFPRIEAFSIPLSGRITILSEDWLNLSSYKERALDLSLDLLSSGNHRLSYNHSWSSLSDPSQPRRHRGHNFVPSLRYSFQIDQRDSPQRPTRGSSFSSNTDIGGLFPDTRSLRFIRQDIDLNHAIPLGFCGAALNIGVIAGVVFTFSVPGFRASLVGGKLSLSALVDLSFDLPSKLLKDAGIHGHVYATSGCLHELPKNPFRRFHLPRLKDSYHAVGAGVIIPTPLFGIQVNYRHIFKPWGHEQGNCGVEFVFS